MQGQEGSNMGKSDRINDNPFAPQRPLQGRPFMLRLLIGCYRSGKDIVGDIYDFVFYRKVEEICAITALFTVVVFLIGLPPDNRHILPGAFYGFLILCIFGLQRFLVATIEFVSKRIPKE